MKTKEHKESNGCEKYHCWRYGLYKINFWQFWRSYCKKTIFVVFHFLKFLPYYRERVRERKEWGGKISKLLWLLIASVWIDMHSRVLFRWSQCSYLCHSSSGIWKIQTIGQRHDLILYHYIWLLLSWTQIFHWSAPWQTENWQCPTGDTLPNNESLPVLGVFNTSLFKKNEYFV